MRVRAAPAAGRVVLCDPARLPPGISLLSAVPLYSSSSSRNPLVPEHAFLLFAFIRRPQTLIPFATIDVPFLVAFLVFPVTYLLSLAEGATSDVEGELNLAHSVSNRRASLNLLCT